MAGKKSKTSVRRSIGSTGRLVASVAPTTESASPTVEYGTSTVSIFHGVGWTPLLAKDDGDRVPFRVDARSPAAITIERSSCEMLLRKQQPMRLCLVGPIAVAAMLVVAASSAEGAPELLYCMEKTGGKYETALKCESGDETGTTLGWEREAGPLAGETVKVEFSSGIGHLQTPNHNIECTSDEGSGEVTGAATLAKVVFISKGCKDTVINQSCNSTEPAGKAGEIITKELDAELVDLKAGPATPGGMLALPVVGTTFTTISCVGGLVKKTVTGEVIGEFPAASSNKMTLSPELLFEENAGKQLWTKVEEGAAVHELTAFGEAAYMVSSETGKTFVNGKEVSTDLMFP